MQERGKLKGLCLIIDHGALRVSPEQAFSLALSAGVRNFQYRDKNASRKEIYDTALRLVLMAHESEALFIINDHADIAVAVGADGVHLGQDDLPIEYARKLLGPEKLIGISTHSLKQAKDAQAAGADYIGFGPLFATTTKDAGQAQGIGALTVVKQAVAIPVIAIGGITHANVLEVIRAGADGVAVISAVLSTDDIKFAAEKMIRNIQEALDR
jgi:thiamine-phosphate pyrophosphorylase